MTSEMKLPADGIPALSTTVLVVDDHDDLRELTAEVLRLAEHQVVTAANGVRALEVLTRTRVVPDVILLDLMMPIMDGITFLQHLRRVEGMAHVPVVVMSALPVAPVEGARVTLRKPVPVGDLLKVVREVTGRR